MKRIFSILLMLPFMVAAQALDISKLTPDQRDLVSKQVQALTQAPAQTDNVAVTVRKEAEAWSQLGSQIGVALISAAKELGVAANEFASTDLGKVVTFIVVYKIIGESILGVVVGGAVMLIGWLVGIWLIRKRVYKHIKYENVPVLFGLMTRTKVVECTPDNSADGGYILFGVAIMFVSFCLGCMIIF